MPSENQWSQEKAREDMGQFVRERTQLCHHKLLPVLVNARGEILTVLLLQRSKLRQQREDVIALFPRMRGVVVLLNCQLLVQLCVKKAPVLRHFLNSQVEVICDVHGESRGNSARHGWRGNVPQIARRYS